VRGAALGLEQAFLHDFHSRLLSRVGFDEEYGARRAGALPAGQEVRRWHGGETHAREHNKDTHRQDRCSVTTGQDRCSVTTDRTGVALPQTGQVYVLACVCLPTRVRPSVRRSVCLCGKIGRHNRCGDAAAVTQHGCMRHMMNASIADTL
jgi:hypothetical protein